MPQPRQVGNQGSDKPGATVDEQIEDSFPASDPPSYNAGGRVGQPHRKQSEERGQGRRATKADK